ncbi:hypothetical protein KY334_07120 [Candidatus Woesearchaeota archaeon]|nr:hypothetical protein [Candidatus Woesearchaeota archaeon]
MKIVRINNGYEVPEKPLYLFGSVIVTFENYLKQEDGFAVVVNGELWRNRQLIAKEFEWELIDDERIK